MSEPGPVTGPPLAPSCIGLVVHPTRPVDVPMSQLRDWARSRGAEVAQIPFTGAQRRLFPERAAEDCDLVVAIGGDGTTLAAMHSAAAAGRPVLGVACGSLGVLTTVAADEVDRALSRLAAGEWQPRAVPALRLARTGGDPEATARHDDASLAFNDVVVARQAEGQVRVAASVDGVLYARVAGDGCIVSTADGSAAYTLAAGGPLLAPGLEAYVLTALPAHGGFAPALVLAGTASLQLAIAAGYGGARLEIDGRNAGPAPDQLSIALARNAATLISFPGQESHLTRLRRRKIIMDSPRILADDARD